MTDPAPTPPLRRAARLVGWILGLALLVAALAIVLDQRHDLTVQLSAIRSPSWPHVALLLGAVAVNLALTGVFFLVLMRRYGRVGVIEMQSLLAGSMLLNYLPMRPGLFGRVAYHRTVNGIAVRDSVRTVVHALVISGATAVGFTALAAAALRGGVPAPWAVAAPLPLYAVAFGVVRRHRAIVVAAFVRYLEIVLWAGRYAIAFDTIGLEIEAGEALALAAVGVLATMVPFVSNGLGLREWAIGMLAPLLTPHTLGHGVTAELVNRLAEFTVVIPVGVIALLDVARRTKQRDASGRRPARDS